MFSIELFPLVNFILNVVHFDKLMAGVPVLPQERIRLIAYFISVYIKSSVDNGIFTNYFSKSFCIITDGL